MITRGSLEESCKIQDIDGSLYWLPTGLRLITHHRQAHLRCHKPYKLLTSEANQVMCSLMSPDSLLDCPMTGKGFDKAMFEQYAQNNFSLRVDSFNHNIEDKSLVLLFMHLSVCQSHRLIINDQMHGVPSCGLK